MGYYRSSVEYSVNQSHLRLRFKNNFMKKGAMEGDKNQQNSFDVTNAMPLIDAAMKIKLAQWTESLPLTLFVL
jgi:hypothetical protein